jgi:hypothetical protein
MKLLTLTLATFTASTAFAQTAPPAPFELGPNGYYSIAIDLLPKTKTLPYDSSFFVGTPIVAAHLGNHWCVKLVALAGYDFKYTNADAGFGPAIDYSFGSKTGSFQAYLEAGVNLVYEQNVPGRAGIFFAIGGKFN